MTWINFFLLPLFSTTSKYTTEFYWRTRSYGDAFFLVRKYFLIVWFIGKCFTTWGWIIIWIMFMLTWKFLEVFLISRYFILFICPRNVSDTFSTYFYFPETLDGLGTGTYFSTLGIFLTFITFFLLGGNISCVTLFDDPDREKSREILFDDPGI